MPLLHLRMLTIVALALTGLASGCRVGTPVQHAASEGPSGSEAVIRPVDLEIDPEEQAGNRWTRWLPSFNREPQRVPLPRTDTGTKSESEEPIW